MASDVIVPEVGELGMEVTFVRWLKQPGDEVAAGDPLFEVDTEKSVMVVEAYASGTLVDVRVGEGVTVAPRDVIGRLLGPGEALTNGDTEAPSIQGEPPGTVESSSAVPAAAPPAAPAPAPGAVSGRLSPRARRVAEELGVSTDGLAGSGPDGLVTESDVRAAARDAGAGGSKSSDIPVSERARRAVAELTTASWQTIPHFYLQLEADVDAALELARPTPLIMAAVAQALVRHPECNLAWDGAVPARRQSVDLGLLVDAPAGLLITVVKDADELDLGDMTTAVREAAERARAGKLAAMDLGARSLTVSNLGMYSVDRFSAVIPRPDILTLAVGRTRTTTRWQGTTARPVKVMDLTLSVDHRALDGAAAARFLSSLEAVLADPRSEGLA